MDQTLAEIVHRQFLECSKKFKPRFGNDQDIGVANQVKKIVQMQKELESMDKGSRSYPNLEEEIHRLEKNTLYLLKQHTNL